MNRSGRQSGVSITGPASTYIVLGRIFVSGSSFRYFSESSPRPKARKWTPRQCMNIRAAPWACPSSGRAI